MLLSEYTLLQNKFFNTLKGASGKALHARKYSAGRMDLMLLLFNIASNLLPNFK